jgi:uncharacterized protein YecE (DUF72 family)
VNLHPITVGTCGWSYKDWVGPFYPKGTAAGDYLSFYAERFKTVEVDSSFYACPSPKMVQGWYNKTPTGFGFSLKIPKTITHEKLLGRLRKTKSRSSFRQRGSSKKSSFAACFSLVI